MRVQLFYDLARYLCGPFERAVQDDEHLAAVLALHRHHLVTLEARRVEQRQDLGPDLGVEGLERGNLAHEALDQKLGHLHAKSRAEVSHDLLFVDGRLLGVEVAEVAPQPSAEPVGEAAVFHVRAHRVQPLRNNALVRVHGGDDRGEAGDDHGVHEAADGLEDDHVRPLVVVARQDVPVPDRRHGRQAKVVGRDVHRPRVLLLSRRLVSPPFGFEPRVGVGAPPVHGTLGPVPGLAPVPVCVPPPNVAHAPDQHEEARQEVGRVGDHHTDLEHRHNRPEGRVLHHILYGVHSVAVDALEDLGALEEPGQLEEAKHAQRLEHARRLEAPKRAERGDPAHV
mmetsp:Transcript_47360/g.107364  ORF Transcript_47360/g.107364 Transcript_47360/m.107364 type:complete len:339 (-) Transcript_47360:1293-2309(-)